MTDSKQFTEVLALIKELSEDSTVPKNVRSSLSQSIKLLEEPSGPGTQINKVLQLLEDSVDNANLPVHIRTQLLNVVSMLEAV